MLIALTSISQITNDSAPLTTADKVEFSNKLYNMRHYREDINNACFSLMIEILNIHPTNNTLSNSQLNKVNNNLDTLGNNDKMFDQFIHKIMEAQKRISHGDNIIEILNFRQYVGQLCGDAALAQKICSAYYQ
jgi:hypothetical protein